MKKYLPDKYYKSIYDVNYKKLKEEKVTVLLIDLDNTIAHPSKLELDKKIYTLFKKIKKDFKVYIVSNSPKIRVKYFAKELDVEYISLALKPFTFKLEKIMNKDRSNYAIIGDQLFTDVKVGKKLDITTVLVDRLFSTDLLITKYNRNKETRLLEKLKDDFEVGKYYE